ncbi:hypothetical protein LTS10_003481 [Elasticomyces elasticus]|nr:hypothetical protein LTS10_003481 [Elasticomyces elasticus]
MQLASACQSLKAAPGVEKQLEAAVGTPPSPDDPRQLPPDHVVTPPLAFTAAAKPSMESAESRKLMSAAVVLRRWRVGRE